jgi:hypothetical protein
MAPPTTVDIMVVLLGLTPSGVHGRTGKISRDRRHNKKGGFTAETEASTVSREAKSVVPQQT